MQLLPGVADSSSSSAAVITHFIYASLRGTETGKKVQAVTEAATAENS